MFWLLLAEKQRRAGDDLDCCCRSSSLSRRHGEALRGGDLDVAKGLVLHNLDDVVCLEHEQLKEDGGGDALGLLLGHAKVAQGVLLLKGRPQVLNHLLGAAAAVSLLVLGGRHLLLLLLRGSPLRSSSGGLGRHGCVEASIAAEGAVAAEGHVGIGPRLVVDGVALEHGHLAELELRLRLRGLELGLGLALCRCCRSLVADAVKRHGDGVALVEGQQCGAALVGRGVEEHIDALLVKLAALLCPAAEERAVKGKGAQIVVRGAGDVVGAAGLERLSHCGARDLCLCIHHELALLAGEADDGCLDGGLHIDEQLRCVGHGEGNGGSLLAKLHKVVAEHLAAALVAKLHAALVGGADVAKEGLVGRLHRDIALAADFDVGGAALLVAHDKRHGDIGAKRVGSAKAVLNVDEVRGKAILLQGDLLCAADVDELHALIHGLQVHARDLVLKVVEVLCEGDGAKSSSVAAGGQVHHAGAEGELDLDQSVAAVGHEALLLAVVDLDDAEQQMSASAQSQRCGGADDGLAGLDDVSAADHHAGELLAPVGGEPYLAEGALLGQHILRIEHL
eukprot:m.130099 g.130099  ORF g.130099 m.130099 type:complete len:564 (-) comp16427_c0_seq2:142-1833(-)